MRAWKIGLAIWLAAASSILPSAAQTTEEELAGARAELERLRAESQELSDQYQAAWVVDAELQTRIDQLESSIADYGVELRILRSRLRERAVNLYMNGAESDLASFFLTASPTDLDTRSEYLMDIRVRDQAMFDGLETLTRRLETAGEELRAEQEEHQRTLVHFEEVAADLKIRLEEGQAVYLSLRQRLEEERAREEEARAAEAAAAAPTASTEPAAAESTTTTTTEPAAAESTTTTTTEPAAAESTTTTTTEPAAAESTTTTTTEPAAAESTTTTTTEPAAEPTTTTEPPPQTTAPASTQPSPDDGTEPDQEPEDATDPEPDQEPDGMTDPEPDQEPEGMTESGMTCPVDGFHTFTDTWGAPRSGGRRHEGVDFLAARGTPVVAVINGVIKRLRNGGLGGITVWLAAANGDEYYYAHLDSWAPDLSVNQKVMAGDLLGTVGTTGNSPDYIPHLHWEFLPGGGKAINPTPLARQLCS